MNNSWIKKTAGYLSGKKSHGEIPGVRVYAFHGVVEKKTDLTLERNLHLISDFREQIELLQKFDVISLGELCDQVSHGKRLSEKTVAITFDDGYANNLIACEILESEGLPWCLFLTAGEVGENRCIWPIELSLLMLHGAAESFEWNEKNWNLHDRARREHSFREVRYALKALAADPRRSAMNTIRSQFPKGETHRLLKEFPTLEMLSWKEVRQLADAGVEIASHGWTHELHHRAQTQSTRIHELRESKAEISKRLSEPCRFFAYPNGDFIESSDEEVRAEGYELAFTTKSGTVNKGSNLWLLPRIEISGPTKRVRRQLV